MSSCHDVPTSVAGRQAQVSAGSLGGSARASLLSRRSHHPQKPTGRSAPPAWQFRCSCASSHARPLVPRSVGRTEHPRRLAAPVRLRWYRHRPSPAPRLASVPKEGLQALRLSTAVISRHPTRLGAVPRRRQHQGHGGDDLGGPVTVLTATVLLAFAASTRPGDFDVVVPDQKPGVAGATVRA